MCQPLCAILLALVLQTAAPAPARATPPPVAAVPAPVLAEGFSWNAFVKYWSNFASRADRVILTVLCVAALSLFIITRGKWR